MILIRRLRGRFRVLDRWSEVGLILSRGHKLWASLISTMKAKVLLCRSIFARHKNQVGLILLLSVSQTLSPTFGQGTVAFNNRAAGVFATHVYEPEPSYVYCQKYGNTSAEIPAGGQIYGGTLLSGSNWIAQIWAAPGADQPESVLRPAYPTTTFRTGLAAGYLSGVTVALTNVVPGAPVATLQVRVFPASSLSWNNAYLSRIDGYSVEMGKSLLFNVTNIGDASGLVLPLIDGLRSFSLSTKGPFSPSIAFLSQPEDQVSYVGAVATFRASAGSTCCPVSYQWKSNGVNIANATNSTLVLTNVLPSFEANYSVVASNAGGQASSTSARISVIVPGSAPTILSQPLSWTVSQGRDASFQVLANGDRPLTYLWQRGAALLVVSTNSSLVLTNLQTNQSGNYFVAVTNAFGSVTSSVASLTVVTAGLVLQRYVNANNTNPIPPYVTWATAATRIQDAVDCAEDGDLIWVTNGIYADGGRSVFGFTTNRVAITKAITLQSVNGPAVTVIQGGGCRCAYLTNNACLSGFTLYYGNPPYQIDGRDLYDYRELNGGGAWCESTSSTISNCIISQNSADYVGGGVYGGTLVGCDIFDNRTWGQSYAHPPGYGYGAGVANALLKNCRVHDNGPEWSSYTVGGGLYGCYAFNSLIYSNRAGGGAGAYFSTLVNCTVVHNSNSAPGLGGGPALDRCGGLNTICYDNSPVNYSSDSAFSNSCTFPLPSTGAGNITNPPSFLGQAGGVGYRLNINSPCIDAGNNAYATNSIDLDGRPRMVGGVVDMGAFEYQGPEMGEFCGWLEKFAIRTDGSADFSDADGDGMNNWQEWRCATTPTNSLSVLQMFAPAGSGSGIKVAWQSVAERSYWLERGTNLGSVQIFTLLATNLAGINGTSTYTDSTAVGSGPFLYRVGVRY